MTVYDSEIEPAETKAKHSRLRTVFQKLIIHGLVVIYLVFATLEYLKSRKLFVY